MDSVKLKIHCQNLNISHINDDVIIQLTSFFNYYPNIDVVTFLSAPIKLYESDVPLGFYLTPCAKTAYVNLLKIQEREELITKDALNRVVKGLKFIFEYCRTYNISFSDYSTFIEEGNKIPSFLSHLKSRDINYYALHSVGFTKPKLDQDILDFMIPNFHQTFQFTRNKLLTSPHMPAIKKAVDKMKLELSRPSL